MPPRRAKHPTPSWVVDQGGEPIQVGGQCGLQIDMQLDHPAPMPGDWIATRAGSRYLVDHVRPVHSRRHSQIKRYQLRCLRLPKHTEPPDDVTVIELTWYPRGVRARP